MRKQALFFSATIVMVLAVPSTQATPVATVRTSASISDYVVTDSDTSFDPLFPAEAHSFADLLTYEAKSDAWTTIGGVVKSVSDAYGNGNYDLYASASTSNTSEWLISSDTLPIGTSIYVLIDLSFSGKLGSDTYWSPSASAGTSFSVNESILYEAGATYSSGTTLDVSGAWISDFAKNGWFYTLDTTDRIGFQALVGQTVTPTLSLETGVSVPRSSESGATADFFNSGSYTFVGAEDPLNPGTMLDVNFEMVPEPTTILLLGLGGLALRRKSRA